MKTYFLFGEDAFNAYNEGGVKQVLTESVESELRYGVYEHDTEKHNSVDLLNAYDGWLHFIVITKDEFNALN